VEERGEKRAVRKSKKSAGGRYESNIKSERGSMSEGGLTRGYNIKDRGNGEIKEENSHKAQNSAQKQEGVLLISLGRREAGREGSSSI